MATRKSILFFCSFPPPFTGQRIATKFIYDILGKYARLELINLSHNGESIKRVSSFKLFTTYIKKYISLSDKLKSNSYDYVYMVFSPSKSALIKDFISASIAKKNSNARLVAHLHCGNYGDHFKGPFFKALFKKLIRKTDTFIFLSRSLNKVPYLPTSKVLYMNNTISNDVACSDEEVSEKISSRKSRSIMEIFYISNMIKEKGYEDLVAAAAVLNEEFHMQFRLHLIGSWPNGEKEKTKLEEYLREIQLEEKVIVHGGITDRKQIKAFFLKADVFVLPTYYSVEAQPLSIIEAFNAGTPVVSTKHASIPDMIEDGINGFLVNKRAPQQLAESIYKLNEPVTWQHMAMHARKKFKDTYADDILLNSLSIFFGLNTK